ncbi:MAG: hypothetical protein AVDCRST_MAG50-1742 [uncultured Acidimicrobiales bacterium]|uniref:Uncharacterized protein n=1 Tax=uncultured Acidimicrobiales bacterium TaxID=310071 RepID=A0A6J4I6F5_9ACTN|nr:MAG: hypothetical protein AVDCRST_MAG50-1742 [uncultured Acidimicrobiales bacterium]
MTHEGHASDGVDEIEAEEPSFDTSSMPVAAGPDDLAPLMPPVYFGLPTEADEA